MGEKIEIFNYFDLLTTDTHLQELILTNIDTLSPIWYNLRYTQEFWDCYLDDWFIFLKELMILKNSDTGHFAYNVLVIKKSLSKLFSLLILQSESAKLVPWGKYACFLHTALWNQEKCPKDRQLIRLIIFIQNWVTFTYPN